MPETFRDRLQAALVAKGSLCPGIDPTRAGLARWDIEDSAKGAAEFGLRYLEVLARRVAVVKPNVAFFEQYGAAGLASLETLLGAAREVGVMTILDAKRGDIESTNTAYARAWLDADSPLAADALTVSPYLGARALTPFFDIAQREGRGVFVVVRSSNPEGRAVQEARVADGRTLEQSLLDVVMERPEVVGAVIGLMTAARPLEVPEATFYLAPGVETQGATWADLGAQFGGMASTPVVVNLSRSLASAGPDAQGLLDAADRAQEKIISELRPRSD